jgi:hypothetical protein
MVELAHVGMNVGEFSSWNVEEVVGSVKWESKLKSRMGLESKSWMVLFDSVSRIREL